MIIKNYQDTKKELTIAQIRLKRVGKTKEILEDEKILLENTIHQLQEDIVNIEASLKALTGIEYKLYYQIVVNGLNVTRAIDKVSMEENKDVSTLWKKYYPKIKNELDLIKI